MERLATFSQLARQVDACFALIDVETGCLPDSAACSAQLQQVGQQLAHWPGRIYQKLASNLTHWAAKLFSYQPVLRTALVALADHYGAQAVAALSALWQLEAAEKRHPQSLTHRRQR